jgi:hypothetical protein
MHKKISSKIQKVYAYIQLNKSRIIYAITIKIMKLSPFPTKLMTRIIDSIEFNNFLYTIFLSKIDTYKIKNQPNIEVIKEKIKSK